MRVNKPDNRTFKVFRDHFNDKSCGYGPLRLVTAMVREHNICFWRWGLTLVSHYNSVVKTSVQPKVYILGLDL